MEQGGQSRHVRGHMQERNQDQRTFNTTKSVKRKGFSRGGGKTEQKEDPGMGRKNKPSPYDTDQKQKNYDHELKKHRRGKNAEGNRTGYSNLMVNPTATESQKKGG